MVDNSYLSLKYQSTTVYSANAEALTTIQVPTFVSNRYCVFHVLCYKKEYKNLFKDAKKTVTK